MQRFNNSYFGDPRYSRRPVGREIRIPVRANGPIPRRRSDNGHGPAEAVATSQQPSVSPAAVEDAQAEAVEWKEKYTRLMAERENERKRLERMVAGRAEQEKEQLLRDMLPLADNLERALAHESGQESGLQEGVELTLKAFSAALARQGVATIEAEGKPFDPNVHEAVGTIPHPTLPPGTVATVEEKGYTLDGRLLRPARVMVAVEQPRSVTG